MRHGPWLFSGDTVRAWMVRTVLALGPVLAVATWRHGLAVPLMTVSTLAGALAAEVALDRRNVARGSAAVTGLVLAVMLPVATPLWLTASAGALAIAAKNLLRGRGTNPLNPAALARVLLMALAPAHLLAPAWTVDGVTGATPLAAEPASAAVDHLMVLLGAAHTTTPAEAAPWAVLLGGVVLGVTRTIDWRVPVAYLGTLLLLGLVLPPGARVAGHAPWLAEAPLLHALAGGAPLAACFLLTDPVASPFTRGGRITSAAFAGAVTMLVRMYTLYPDAAVLAVLAANLARPWVDGGLRRVGARARDRTSTPDGQGGAPPVRSGNAKSYRDTAAALNQLEPDLAGL